MTIELLEDALVSEIREIMDCEIGVDLIDVDSGARRLVGGLSEKPDHTTASDSRCMGGRSSAGIQLHDNR